MVSCECLEKRHLNYWLSIIKQGWIVDRDPVRIIDEFCEDGTLKKALELLELTDEELTNDDD